MAHRAAGIDADHVEEPAVNERTCLAPPVVGRVDLAGEVAVEVEEQRGAEAAGATAARSGLTATLTPGMALRRS